VWAVANGSLSGTIRDPSGSVIEGARITLVNVAHNSTYSTVSNAQGYYSFPTLPVGRYDMTIEAAGFKTEKKTDLQIDTDAAVAVEATLQLGQESETVVVQASDIQIDTVATHLGEVVTGSQMTALPLNGRSFTDLIAIQSGIIPVTTLLPSSVVMAGVTGSLAPSGDLNPGNLAIDGQRESSNGFMVDGIDVQEHVNGGTSIVPNLDSIYEFRVLTNNYDPEYGNYNGGMIIVITRSGGDAFHGKAFEFFRNTALDARGYFDPTSRHFPPKSIRWYPRRSHQAPKNLFFRRLSRHANHRRRGDGPYFRAFGAGPRRKSLRCRQYAHRHGEWRPSRCSALAKTRVPSVRQRTLLRRRVHHSDLRLS